MFNQLLEIIEGNSEANFDTLLKKASVEVFLEGDSKFGGTLIHWAALNDKVDILTSICTFLEEHKKKLKRFFSQTSNNGQTPLHWCAYDKAPQSCDFFLTHFEALVSVCNKKGLSPLHLAAKENQREMVQLLCDYDEKNAVKNAKKWLIHARTPREELAIDLTSDPKIKLCLSTSALRKHPLHAFLGVHLSTHRNYLAHSPIKSSPLKQSELYYRSGKHPFVRELGSTAEIMYTESDVKLDLGMKAHVGSYGNLLQIKGDSFKPKKHNPKHHPSDAKLYDCILNYKNELCANAVLKFAQQRPNALIKVGHWNDYPSIMVHIPKTCIHKAQKTKNPSRAAFENWVDFVLSYYLGLINFAAYEKNLPIEMQRRGGFGFFTPTAAPTGDSFRISMGIVPNDYIDLLVKILIDLDKLLLKLNQGTLDLPALEEDVFYGSKPHRTYLEKYDKKIKPDDLVELLWTQVEKGGQTTVQNIMRTSYARDGIAKVVFTHCYEKGKMKPAQAFNSALVWAIEQIKVKKATLTFEVEDDLNYPVCFKENSYLCKEANFWKIIALIYQRTSLLEDEVTKACLIRLSDIIKTQNIQALYYNLDLLNEAIFTHSVNNTGMKKNATATKIKEEYGDFYGSDSDEEDEINNKPVFAKKIVTHSGMRAIWASLIAINSRLGDLRIYLQNAYYETSLGLKIIAQLGSMENYTIVKQISEANVILCDINACVTNGTNPVNNFNVLKKEKRYIILDATSATSFKIHTYLSLLTNGRANSLLIAESGFKNQQLAGDKNPHGIVRIFSIDSKKREQLYKAIKESEPPLTSPTAHHYRHSMKLFGATLSNKAILSLVNQNKDQVEEKHPTDHPKLP